jgi:hypothetical protein
LTLQDSHSYNILFEKYHPVFVDIGSIIPANSDVGWPVYDEFCRFFIYPLQLAAQKKERIARWLLHDFIHGIPKSDFEAISDNAPVSLKNTFNDIKGVIKKQTPSLYSQLKKRYDSLKVLIKKGSSPENKPHLDFMRNLRHEVEGIVLPSMQTEWSEYYGDNLQSFSPSEDWTQKHRSVYKILSTLTPFSVLDIGSNRGWYSQLAAHLGSNVVSFDTDEMSIGKLYQDAQNENISMLPLVMDIRNPSPGYGLCNRSLAPAVDRLNCDLVLALALVHHLVYKQYLTFEQIAEATSSFSKKWLLIEFIPKDDQYVREWWNESYSWYTLDNFIFSMKKKFGKVMIYPSFPEPRVLLLCEK